MTTPMQPYPHRDARDSVTSTPPASVQGAFWIYVVVAALSVISIILVLTDGTFDRAIEQAGAGSDATNIRGLVSAVRITTIVAAVVFTGLYLLFAVKMRNGRNWARIVLTVLSALTLVSRFTVSNTVTVNGQTYTSTTNSLFGWVGVVAAAVGIVLMYLRTSNAYFSAHRTQP